MPKNYNTPGMNQEMPNGKQYTFNIQYTNEKGQAAALPLVVKCAYVGQTGMQMDPVYELTYYFAA